MPLPSFNTDTFGPHLAWRRLPLLYLQGQWLRLRTRRLPEPPGDRHGRISGATPALNVLVVGDSAAVAVGTAQQSQGLAPMLANALAQKTGRAVNWRALGRSGSKAGDVVREQHALFSSLDGCTCFDLIVTSLGVNDAVGLSGSKNFQHDLGTVAALLDARLAEDGQLVFSRMPPIHRSAIFREPLRGLVQWRLAWIDALLSHVANRSERWRLAQENPSLVAEGFAVDGFHPSAEGYRAWAWHLAEGYSPADAQNAGLPATLPDSPPSHRT